MPVGGIHGGISADKASRSGGGSKGAGLRGISQTRAGVVNADGKEVGRTGGPGSGNAAVGTYSQGTEAQTAAYGGMLDAGFGAQLADAIIGALPFINRTTKVNPVSGFTESNYTGGILDGLGSIFGGMMGAPGLGMLGGWADSKLGTNVDLGTDTYGSGWGGQSAGGGYSGGAPGMGGGGGYVARGGQGSPGAPAVMSVGSPPPAAPQAPVFNPGSGWGIPGFSMNTRFGQGAVSPYGMMG